MVKPNAQRQTESTTTDEASAYLEGFLAAVERAGYTRSMQYNKKWLIAPFVSWARDKHVALADMDEGCVEAFLSCPSRRRYHHRTALLQFIKYLRSVEAVRPRASKPSPADGLFQRYLDHLKDRQGLSRHSIAAYSPLVREFIVAKRLPDHAAALDAISARGHLLDHVRNRSVSFGKLLAAALRSFLRFCFLEGVTTTDLSPSVPPVRRWQLSSLPPFLTADQVEHVIATADRTTLRGCRDFAIVLLLARLGLRASEVITLELGDIRWGVGEIWVRGKGQLHDRLPLLADVGEALASYLRTARGPTESRRVFVRRVAPRVGLSLPADVSRIAREALHRAGLSLTGRVGAHVFRHSLATRMIRCGASLAEISQVLRHRSTRTTQHYAKVEFEGLRDVALPWPSLEEPK
jgi:integrase/recombinase XerD